VNPALRYSTPWRAVKIAARRTVTTIPRIVPRRLPWISEWCAYVTAAPLDSRMIVLSSGISYGDSASIPCGGQ